GVRRGAGAPQPPADDQVCEQALAAARASLDEAAFAAAWAEGKALPIEEAVAYGLADAARVSPRDPAARVPAGELLTPREREVATLVARGLSNRDIAATLVISERTVEAHVGHALGKLGLSSRTQLAVWAAEQRLGDTLSQSGGGR